MHPRSKSLITPLEIKADRAGHATAAIVKYDTVDLDGDVVLRSAWPVGSVVAIQPAHNWTAPPLGEGTLATTDAWGTVDLDFFLATSLGHDWYEAVKARGPRQQWSFGYRVLDSEPGTLGGQPVQFLKALEVFEASPVLLAAQPLSHTVAIKGGERLADHAGRVLAEVAALTTRITEVAALRAGEGRTVSDATRTDLAALVAALDALAGTKSDLATLLAPVDAPPAGGDAALRALYDELQALERYYGPVRAG